MKYIKLDKRLDDGISDIYDVILRIIGFVLVVAFFFLEGMDAFSCFAGAIVAFEITVQRCGRKSKGMKNLSNTENKLS